MVTAGVFLLARASFLFEHSQILYFITLIGRATAIYGGLMALRQSDIKKVIAFSTCSQLGYMVMACGLSCYDLAIFHLATHAFFKALLFLAAGSVIHATHQQELSQLGGLKKSMPITYITFLIGSLAIMGIYPFAGYYSKEAILFASYGKEPLLFYCALVASGFTTLYSIKLILFVFHGRSKEYEHPPHESPLLMIAPITLLALGAMFMGWYLENVFNIVSQTQGYFKSTIFIAEKHKVAHLEPSTLLHNMPLIISAISTIAMAMFFYSKTLQKIFAYIACCIFDYFDAFYNVVFVRIFNYLSCCSIWVDIKIFDGLGPKATMRTLNTLSKAIKKLHNGYISNYTNYLIIVFLSVMTTLMYIIY
jgi:NADH-quinone oxidoreductase subunit L